MIKVGVIFGGQTVEHEVSVITAVQAMANFNKEKYEIVPLYVAKDGSWYSGKLLEDIDIYKDMDMIKKYAKKVTIVKKDGVFYLQSLGFIKRLVDNIDIAFPMVHGNNVEDGTVQGYLQMLGIPYVGSKILGSALGQDKVVMKQVFSDLGLPIVEYVNFFDIEYQDNPNDITKKIKKMGFPVIVKPSNLGSSIGITFVKTEEQLDNAIMDAISYDHKIIVEKAVSNLIEVNCSVLGTYENQETSVLEEVVSDDDFLSFNEKYTGENNKKGSKGMLSTKRIIPARLDSKLESEIKDISVKAFKALNLSGVCRIDFLIDSKTKKVYINEPNTIPGCLSFYLWEKTNKSYEILLDDLVSIAIKEYKKRQQKVVSFDTNILKSFNGIKGIKGMKK